MKTRTYRPAGHHFTTTGLWAIDARRAAMLPHSAEALPTQPTGAKAPSKPYDVEDGVAIIELDGVMLKAPSFWDEYFGDVVGTAEVGHMVRMAAVDRDVQSIVLKICSPGGQVAGASELADSVTSATKRKPIIAFIEDSGCSAAYWVASQADRVFVNKAGFVGSIGTYCVLQDVSKMLDQVGIKFTVVGTGEYKGLGADGVVSAKLVAEVQREVDSLNAIFLQAVAKGRGMTLAEVQAVATGQAWIGSEALKRGLVDAVGTMGRAMQYAAAAAPKVTTPAPVMSKTPAGSTATLSAAQRASKEWDEKPEIHARYEHHKSTYVLVREHEIISGRYR